MYDGPPNSRTKIYAARVSYAANDARMSTALLLPRALPLEQTDGRTDGHGTVLMHVKHTRPLQQRLSASHIPDRCSQSTFLSATHTRTPQ